jgi:protein gp37
MNSTKIEWASKTWSPITGCTPISEGCKNCYARRMANRLRGRCGYPKDDPFRVTFHPDRINKPLRLRKPTVIFVGSMGDLFHEDMHDEWIDEIISIIAATTRHCHLILTKRPERMLEYFDEIYNLPTDSRRAEILFDTWRAVYGDACNNLPVFPLRNLWLGVTGENQKAADERIPILLQIPAAMRFVSYEPALGPVDFRPWMISKKIKDGYREVRNRFPSSSSTPKHLQLRTSLDWIIAGGETGPGARPSHPDWFRSVRDQCVAAGVPFFFKSWGEWVPRELALKIYGKDYDPENNVKTAKVGRKVAGRLLDGREWNETPG